MPGFGRDRADEGHCSPRASLFSFFSPERKQLALKPPNQKLELRLPWGCAEDPILDTPNSHVYRQGAPAGVVGITRRGQGRGEAFLRGGAGMSRAGRLTRNQARS
jgi:hypothetical protein